MTALDAGRGARACNGEIFPISARSGAGVDPLVEQLVTLLPEGPFLYPPEDQSDQSEEVRIAELVREQVLLRTREELPHAVEVELDELEEREDGLLVVRARIWAETESQKGILVGAGGRMVKAVGTAARARDRGAARPARPPRPARARAQGLAPRRGAARPARHRMTLERIVGYLRRTEEAIVDEVRPARHATALLTPSCRWCGSSTRCAWTTPRRRPTS